MAVSTISKYFAIIAKPLSNKSAVSALDKQFWKTEVELELQAILKNNTCRLFQELAI